MTTALRRYEFSERLAEILGESRRDLRFRVTLLVSGGLIPPGPRGPGSPPATPDYAADLLIGVLAAPQQVHTADAVRCYRDLVPAPLGRSDGSAGISLGVRPRRPVPPLARPLACAWNDERFGDALARLLDLARAPESRASIREGLFGIWLSRGFPAAAIQLAALRHPNVSAAVVSRRYELPPGARPPAWLDPDRGGAADPGLFHSVFLPVSKLIEIGTLTAPLPRASTRTAPAQIASVQSEGIPAVIDLRQKIADLAGLAQRTRDRRPWEKFLDAAAVAEDLAEHIDDRERGLVEVTSFGANPGNLRMLTHLPDVLPPKPALVVVLHGCTQTAASYDTGTGWSTLADRHGFALLLPEQRRRNNPLRCFNWFRGEDNQRDCGEAASIRQMVDRMIADHGIDPAHIYVTGLSAGGAMTSVLLASYPDVFAGGAILSAVPYRCAEGLQDAFEVIFQGRSLPAAEWGARVRAASDHQGPWPTVSVWHGDADSTVKPINQAEIVKQWLDVHGLASAHTHEETVNGHTRRVWHDGDGRELVQSWTIAGMAHGAAIDPGGADGCGVAGPFINDVGLSSTFHIARSWGLTETRREVPPRAPRPAKAQPRRPEPRWASLAERGQPVDIPVREAGDVSPPPPNTPAPTGGRVIRIDTHGNARLADRQPPQDAGPHPEREAAHGAGSAPGATPGTGSGIGGLGAGLAGGIDVHAIITKSFEAAGLLKSDPSRPSGGGGPLGIDIPGIIATSLEAAGVLKGSRSPNGVGTPGAGRSGMAGGIDLQSILTRSFEAAGLLRTPPAPPPAPLPASAPASAGEEQHEAPPAEPPAEIAPEAPAAETPATTERAPLWEGDGWRLHAGEPEGPGENAGEGEASPAVLHGCASSGTGGEVGRVIRSVDCRVALGDSPTLTYGRRLQLQADANMFTTASFGVLVDGEPVDEASATGMDYAEADWTERAGIDLFRFAGRTVTLTFQVSAHANVFQEVFAKAWVRDIVIRDADAATEAGTAV